MKANALYHLMQLRARKLSEHLPDDSKATLEEIQSSIKITRQPGTYIIDWNVNQTDYSITMESDPFKFYEKGDNAKRNAKRLGDLNYRTHNWDAALELWRDIFRTSNLDPGPMVDDGKLAFGNFLENDSRSYSIENIVVALSFASISFIKYPLVEVIQLFIVVLALLLFSESFSSVQLRKPMRILDKIIVAAGGIVPLSMGIDQAGMIFNLAALYLLTKAEKNTTKRLFYYVLSGACFGFAAYATTVFSTVLAGILAVLLVIVSVVDRTRVKRVEAVLFLVCSAVSISIVSLSISYGYLPVYVESIVVASPDNVSMISSIFLLVLATCFSLWWVTGVQYYLIPWLSLLALSLAGAYTVYIGDIHGLLKLAVFTGFIIFVAYRVFFSIFFRNNRITKQ